MRAESGLPEPLGVTPAAGGANVAVWSRHATAIELCVFAGDGDAETARIRLPARTADVFHGFVRGLEPGARYGLRAHGPWDPRAGHRFNPAKLLVDPYARALDRPFGYDPALAGAAADPLLRDPRDTAALVPKGVVTAVASAAAPLASAVVGDRALRAPRPRLHACASWRARRDPRDLRGTRPSCGHRSPAA